MGHLLLLLIRFYRRITNRKYGWFGNYETWQQAMQRCTGYHAPAILEKVRSSTLKVKREEAVYERSSRLHDKIHYSWPMLANLLWIASKNKNKLSVIDFGGSLGSSFFQNRKYFKHLESLQWSVVEQENFVRVGQNEITTDQLRFYFTVDEAIKEKGLPDVFLISCALPYFEKPYEVLKNNSQKRFPYFIIDNTYFNSKNSDRLTIQKVPPIYYNASYPAWFLDYEKVKATLKENYEITEEYVNEEFLYLDGEKIEYRGFIAALK